METIIIIGGDMNKFIAFYVVGTTIRTHFPFCLFLYFHPKKKSCRDFFFVIMAHYYFFSIENWELGDWGAHVKKIFRYSCVVVEKLELCQLDFFQFLFFFFSYLHSFSLFLVIFFTGCSWQYWWDTLYVYGTFFEWCQIRHLSIAIFRSQ